MNAVIDRLRGLTVRDVMSRSVVWVTKLQHMADVATLLLKHELSTAPVVDENGRCVGMLSATDFLKRDSNASEWGNAAHRPRPAWTPDDVAATYMSSGVQAIAADATLLQAAKVMAAQHVHRLPVVDIGGKPVGIVSTMDVVAALLHALNEQGIVV